MKRAVRIGNASGFYGDRHSAMRELVATADVDVITGDYLAELTMLILGKDQLRDPSLGYARTFVTQIEQCLGDAEGPVVAATDYMRMFANQIRPYVRQRYRVLGTDGFGRSDYRRRLRDFFEVDRRWVTLAALESLALDGTVPAAKLGEAIKKYGIDPDKPNPAKV